MSDRVAVLRGRSWHRHQEPSCTTAVAPAQSNLSSSALAQPKQLTGRFGRPSRRGHPGARGPSAPRGDLTLASTSVKTHRVAAAVRRNRVTMTPTTYRPGPCDRRWSARLARARRGTTSVRHEMCRAHRGNRVKGGPIAARLFEVTRRAAVIANKESRRATIVMPAVGPKFWCEAPTRIRPPNQGSVIARPPHDSRTLPAARLAAVGDSRIMCRHSCVSRLARSKSEETEAEWTRLASVLRFSASAP